MQFLIGAADVSAHGRDSDIESTGDLFIWTTLRHQLEHLALARGERITVSSSRCRVLTEILHNFPRNVAGYRRAALMYLFQCGEQFVMRSLLKQITGRARRQ